MINEESGWKQFVSGALDFIFPPLCLGCGKYEASDRLVCDTCEKSIDTFEQPICLTCKTAIIDSTECSSCRDKSFALFAYGNYQPPFRDIIIQFKFHGITTVAAYYASRLYERFSLLLDQCQTTCLVPIPLHPHRENQRGYNQAVIFAKELNQLMELPVNTELLIRTKKRKPQARLDFKHRLQNIRDVFAVSDNEESHLRVLLVDDVVTTGATVMEAKRTLETAGHIVVGAIALAHGV